MFADNLAKALSGFTGLTPTPASLGVASSVRTAISTITGQEFFGPTQPMLPVAPGTDVRQRDYPYAWNLLYRPRSEQVGPSFEQLRMVAYSYDLLRACIETRKDQIAKFPYDFKAIKKPGEKKKDQAKRTESSPDIPVLKKLFDCPDGQNDFQGWVRMLMEDVLVVDAMSIAVIKQNSRDIPEPNRKFQFNDNRTKRRVQSGQVVRLLAVDGATIKPLIDPQGVRPLPPDPGYQQNIKNMPALNLTQDDLIYRPRNPRTSSGYGLSCVEQCLMVTNIGLRRELSQLDFFTSGNVPECMIAAPENWSVEEIRKMQAYFDSLEGDLSAKRRVRWIPATKSVTMTKEPMLKDEFDEWLARVICYIFSLPPTPFVRQMNRAVAQQVQETALQEGLLPMLNWLAGVFNWIIHRNLGMTDVEFVWDDEAEPDQLKQAQIDKIYISVGKNSIDEIRERDGEDPFGIGPFFAAPTGPIMLQPFIDGQTTGVPTLPQPEETSHPDNQLALQDARAKIQAANAPPQPGNAASNAPGGNKPALNAAPKPKDTPQPGQKKLPAAAKKYLERIGGTAPPEPFHPRISY